MAHFWDGQGEHGRASGKPRRGRWRGGETLRGTHPCQGGESHQHKRDVPVPASETADLIVIQSQIFAIFKILFDMPACANGRNHLWQRGPLWPKDEVVRFLVGISQAATNEQPMTLIIFPSMQNGNVRPVEEPGPLLPSLIERRCQSWACSKNVSTCAASTRLRTPSGVSIPTGSLQATAST